MDLPDQSAPVASPRGPGRPRLYPADDERRLLMDATAEVLRGNQGADATMAEILAEAGLSTRAFYRHFGGKEDIIRALYQRDAESFGRHIRERLDQTPSPAAALEAWVNEILGLAYDRRRAERMTAFSSPMVGRIVGGTEAERVGSRMLLTPLQEVLARGAADGSFPDARPDLDTYTILAVTWEAISWARGGGPRLSRNEAVAQVLRFVLPALGVRR